MFFTRLKQGLGRIYRKLFKSELIYNFKLAYFPKNSFKPIKIKKSKYYEIKKQIENYCDEIIQQINSFKTTHNFTIDEPTTMLESYEVVSRVGDYLGPVIRVEDKYYRCIKKESLSKFVKLWESGIIQVFSLKGYVPKIKISNYYTDEYPIILEQETIKIIKLKEISLDQSKKAAFFISLLQYICKKNGCVLLDPHFYNFTIENGKYVYYDLGSFCMVDKIENYDEFSLVIMGMYRILFSYFPDSVLSRQELGFFRYDAKKYQYTLDLHEFSFFRKKTLKYHRIHSSRIVYRALKNIFVNLSCLPWDIVICFMYDEVNNIENLLNEIL